LVSQKSVKAGLPVKADEAASRKPAEDLAAGPAELRSMLARARRWKHRPIEAVDYVLERQGVLLQILYKAVERLAAKGDSSPALVRAIQSFQEVAAVFAEIASREPEDAKPTPGKAPKVRKGVPKQAPSPGAGEDPPDARAREAYGAGEVGERPISVPDVQGSDNW